MALAVRASHLVCVAKAEYSGWNCTSAAAHSSTYCVSVNETLTAECEGSKRPLLTLDLVEESPVWDSARATQAAVNDIILIEDSMK